MKPALEPTIVSRNGWRVVLAYLGEGYCGDYAPSSGTDDEDHGDDPMIRLTIHQKINDKWQQVKTMMTYLQATDKIEIIEQAAHLIMDELVQYEGTTWIDLWQKLATIHVVRKEARFLPAYGSAISEDD